MISIGNNHQRHSLDGRRVPMQETRLGRKLLNQGVISNAEISAEDIQAAISSETTFIKSQ